MTTIAILRQEIQTARTEDREDRARAEESNKEEHREILTQLKEMNGTQRDHSVKIAEVCKVQEHQGEDIAKGDEERGALFKMVRKLTLDKVRIVSVVAGAVSVVWILLQFVVAPLIQNAIGG